MQKMQWPNWSILKTLLQITTQSYSTLAQLPLRRLSNFCFVPFSHNRITKSFTRHTQWPTGPILKFILKLKSNCFLQIAQYFYSHCPHVFLIYHFLKISSQNHSQDTNDFENSLKIQNDFLQITLHSSSNHPYLPIWRVSRFFLTLNNLI